MRWLWLGALIDRASHGPDHPDVARDLNNLGLLLQATNRLAEAEPMYRRALAIVEASYGPDHPDVAATLNNLGLLLQATNRLAEVNIRLIDVGRKPMVRRKRRGRDRASGWRFSGHRGLCESEAASESDDRSGQSERP
jgi:tetratricopeptide (TPR) repeat protein